jgi:hypothetical protein
MLFFGLAVVGAYDGIRFERCDPTGTTSTRELRQTARRAPHAAGA